MNDICFNLTQPTPLLILLWPSSWSSASAKRAIHLLICASMNNPSSSYLVCIHMCVVDRPEKWLLKNHTKAGNRSFEEKKKHSTFLLLLLLLCLWTYLGISLYLRHFFEGITPCEYLMKRKKNDLHCTLVWILNGNSGICEWDLGRWLRYRVLEALEVCSVYTHNNSGNDLIPPKRNNVSGVQLKYS